MSKKIGNAMLIKRMQNRFSTTDLEPEILQLSETIIPVTQADEAIKKLKEAIGIYSVTATGFYTVLTCPAGKRYYVLAVQAAVGSGTYTMNKVTLSSPSGQDMTMKAQTTAASIQFTFPFPIYLDKNWKIKIGVDVYSVTGDMNTVVYYLESEGDNE